MWGKPCRQGRSRALGGRSPVLLEQLWGMGLPGRRQWDVGFLSHRRVLRTLGRACGGLGVMLGRYRSLILLAAVVHRGHEYL